MPARAITVYTILLSISPLPPKSHATRSKLKRPTRPQLNEYIIRITEFYSKDDNYSFKVEILRQFSKYLHKIENESGIMFTEIRVKCRNTDENQSMVNLKLIQKTFAPLVFQKFAVFFFDENNKQLTLTEFVKRPMCVGNLQIVRKT